MGRPLGRPIHPNLLRPSGFRSPPGGTGAGRPTRPHPRAAPQSTQTKPPRTARKSSMQAPTPPTAATPPATRATRATTRARARARAKRSFPPGAPPPQLGMESFSFLAPPPQSFPGGGRYGVVAGLQPSFVSVSGGGFSYGGYLISAGAGAAVGSAALGSYVAGVGDSGVGGYGALGVLARAV